MSKIELSKKFVHASGAIIDQFMATMLDNAKMAPVKVNHKELERHGLSTFTSKCPVCSDGILLMRRDPITFVLQKNDQCISCGRHVIYCDIQESVTLSYIL